MPLVRLSLLALALALAVVALPAADDSRFGPGVLVPPEERGARIDESTVVHTLRIDPADPTAYASPAAAWPAVRAHLAAGEATKLVLAPGVHRGSWGPIAVDDAIRDTLLVIEGAGKDATAWVGSVVYGPERWRDLGDGLYVTDWPHDWGNHCYVWEAPEVLGQRSEMVFVDGELMTPVLLERYDYRRSGRLSDHGQREHSWTYRGFRDPVADPTVLPPGSFGVAERGDNGDRLFLRLPTDARLEDVLVEVAEHRNPFAFVAGSPFEPGKHRLVLRGITFRHFASRTRDWGREDTIALGRKHRHLLVEDCAFDHNNATGLRLHGSHITVRDSRASHNGFGGFGGEFGIAVLEDNVTNYNNWRGAIGGLYGWNWGGVKFGGAHGGNQTVRGHQSIGNLTHGFWYDIHPHHVDLEDLVLAANWQSGLFLELAQGPFTVRRVLAAGNRKAQFAMSIVGDFVVEDSIFAATPGDHERLKDQEVPRPVVRMQWYRRTDEHADHRPLAPERFVFRDCVLYATNATGGMINEHNGYAREHDFYRAIDQAYHGAGNLFFAVGAEPAFTYVRENWRPITVDLAAWRARTREIEPTVRDPGFVDVAAGDFTLGPDSPLAPRAERLPLERLDPASLAAAERLVRWVERATALDRGAAGDRLEDAGIMPAE